MATHAEIAEYGYRVESEDGRGRRRRRRRPPQALTRAETLIVGWGAGLLAGVVFALPLILWDWSQSAHRALELPMAITAWLFGLNHFSHQMSLVWPIVIGFAILCVDAVGTGLAFTRLVDRVYRITTLTGGLVAGLAWGLTNFILFWYVLLPIARHGAPFHAVAPHWVWVLSFTVFGLALGAFYAILRTPPREGEEPS